MKDNARTVGRSYVLDLTGEDRELVKTLQESEKEEK